MLRPNLCNFSDASTVVKGIITVNNKKNNDKDLIFKNISPFTSCISKIKNTLIDNAEDIDVVMLMYNLTEHSKKYSKTSISL